MNPTIERYNATGKILIVDNYIDRSAAIAKDCGVRDVSETRSVYGLAVFSRPETGMWNDHGNVIIFCDCDSTYVFSIWVCFICLLQRESINMTLLPATALPEKLKFWVPVTVNFFTVCWDSEETGDTDTVQSNSPDSN